MRKLLVFVVLSLVGCPETPQPPPGNQYCEGTPPPTTLEAVAAKISTIIGGTPSTDRRATVLVWITDPTEATLLEVHPVTASGYCSGTAVGPHTVLTAAHCDGELLEVVIEGQTFTADDKLKHPDYVRFPNDDLLLLFFEDALPGPYVSAVYDASMRASCSRLWAQGFGKSESAQIDLNETPYRVISTTTKTLQTTGEDGGRHCFGDSGSGLYAETEDGLKLAGVCSTTYSSDCMIGGDYVNLFHYKNWLAQNIH